MSILDRFFKKQEKPVAMAAAQIVNEPTGVFAAYTGNAYANDTFRAGVDAIARNISKMKGTHYISYADHEKISGDCRLNRLLQLRPNPYMSAADMLYKTAVHYFTNNNAFLFLERDGRGVTGIYPISATTVEMLADPLGNLYCRFYFKSGREAVFSYRDIIHLRRCFNSDDLLGDSNAALDPAIQLAHAQNEGAITAIKNGANIRGILNYTQLMPEEKLKAEKQKFVEDYLQISNDGGVIATDMKATYTPIENRPTILSATQTQEIKRKIYDYLGISENIVNSSYTEDEFAAFYESVLEPFAVTISQEFTSKIFTDREITFGNQIIFESGRMQFTSNQTKVNLIKELMPLGLLTINQALEVMNLPAIEGGERRLQTLNVVNVDQADAYQMNRAKGDAEGNG